MALQIGQMDMWSNLSTGVASQECKSALAKSSLERLFASRMDGMVKRILMLPAHFMPPPDRKFDYIFERLKETRELFVFGQFFPCVGMCGILNERINKDLYDCNKLELPAKKGNLGRRQRTGRAKYPPPREMVDLCVDTQIMTKPVADASKLIIDLRNSYLHGEGKAPQTDALKSISLVEKVVEGTVTVPQNWEFMSGKMKWLKRKCGEVND